MAEPMIGPAADVVRLSTRKRRDRHRTDQSAADLKAVMETPQGRRFMWGLLDHCRINGSTLPPDAGMAVREGERSVGVWLQSRILAACPEGYQRMFSDAWAERALASIEERTANRKDVEDAGSDDPDEN